MNPRIDRTGNATKRSRVGGDGELDFGEPKQYREALVFGRYPDGEFMRDTAPGISATGLLMNSAPVTPADNGSFQPVKEEAPSEESRPTLIGSTGAPDPVAEAEALQQALAADPSLIDSRVRLLRLAIAHGDAPYMADAAREALAASPKAANVLELAAKALFKAKCYGESVRAWNEVAVLKPRDAGVLMNAARALERDYRYADAADAALEAIRIQTNDASALLTAAENLHKSNRLAELESVVRQLADCDLQAALALLPLLSRDQAPLAAEILGRGRASPGVHVDWEMADAVISRLLDLGRAALEGSDHAAASEYFRSVLLLAPHHREAAGGIRRCLGQLYDTGNRLFTEERFAEAIAQFRAILAIDGNEVGGLWKLANALERVGATNEALESWGRLVRLSDDPRFGARFIRAIGSASATPSVMRAVVAARSAFVDNPEFERRGDGLALRLAKAEIETSDAGELETADIIRATETLELTRLWRPDGAACRRLSRSLRHRFLDLVRGPGPATKNLGGDDPRRQAAVLMACDKLADLAETPDDWDRLVREANKTLPLTARLTVYARARPHLGTGEIFLRRGSAMAHKLSRAAKASADAGDLDAALAALEAVAEWEPGGEVYGWLSRRLLKQLTASFRESVAAGRDERSLFLAQRLTGIDPDNLPAIEWLADYQFRNREFGVALVSYQRLLAVRPDRPSLVRRFDKCREEINRRTAA